MSAAMTPGEYARHRGCSASYVRRLKRNGRAVLTADGLIDAAATDAALAATDDPTRGGKHGADAGPESSAPADISLREAMRRERLARARLAELELGEEAGELIRAAEVSRNVFTLARQALERLRSIPSRLRHQLAAASDAAACEALLDAEVVQVCAELQAVAQSMQTPAAAPAAREAIS